MKTYHQIVWSYNDVPLFKTRKFSGSPAFGWFEKPIDAIENKIDLQTLEVNQAKERMKNLNKIKKKLGGK